MMAALAVPAAGPPRLVASSFMTVSSIGFLLCFCVRCFGQPFDGGESPVPLRGEVRHGPSGLVKSVGFYLVENLSTLLAPTD